MGRVGLRSEIEKKKKKRRGTICEMAQLSIRDQDR